MKKLINDPVHVVDDMLKGLLLMHGGWARLADHPVLVRSDIDEVRQRQVALVSGGGSGHEPAHAGYVGAGMLSGAVAGEVFTSPTPNSILAAIRAVAGAEGVLLIVKNYTGDRLNFGLAAEMARAEGIKVEMAVIGDDVALSESDDNAGRRGLAGTVLVHKVAGAAASEGKSLSEIASLARATAQDVATMGVSLSAGTIPAVGTPSFTLGESEMELGLGIHGEPGVRRVPLERADDLAERLVEWITTAHRLRRGERVAVLLNNLGASTTMELGIFAGGALNALQTRGVVTERVYSGTFLSSLDTAGVSLSILRVNDERLRLLDAATSAPAWPNALAQPPGPYDRRLIVSANTGMAFQPRPTTSVHNRSRSGESLRRVIEEVCRALSEAEPRLTDLDRIVGDGDLGTGMRRGVKAVETALPSYSFGTAGETLKALALTLQEALGGSSGPLYGVLLLRASRSLEHGGADEPRSWTKALLAGCEGVMELGDAKMGDRTMLDALLPFAQSLAEELEQGRSTEEALATAASRAETAAEETANLLPRRGRSSYLGERALGTPDPGAVAVAVWLRAAVSALSKAR